MTSKSKFDHYPLANGSVIPLRRHVADIDGSDVLEFGVSGGTAKCDGDECDIAGTVGCNIEITFKHPGIGERGEDRIRYYVKIDDVVEAAYEQFKRDRALHGEDM